MAGSQPPPRQAPTLDWSGGYSYVREPEGGRERLREHGSGALPVAALAVVTLALALALPVAERIGGVKLAPPERALDFAGDHLPVAEIGARVARLRGVDATFSPNVEVVPEDQLVSHLVGLTGGRGRADRELNAAARAQAAEVILRTTGMVPQDFAPADAGLGAAGLYEPRSNTVFIPFEQLGAGGVPTEEILAHEFTHALDDQLYGELNRAFGAASPEAAEAMTALVEGSASYVEQLYMERYLGQDTSVAELLHRRLASDEPYDAAIQKAGLFRYVAGIRFVAALHERGGWRLVNRAFQHPPTSMEQILHPERWLRGESFARPTLLQPPHQSRWVGLGFAPFSEVDTDVMLSTAFHPVSSARAAEGWAGGRVGVWRERSAPADCPEPCRTHTVVVVEWRWDNVVDAQQFLRAADGYLQLALDGKRQGPYVWKLDGGYAGIAGRTPGEVAGITGETVPAATALVFAPRAELAGELAQDAAVAAGVLARAQR